jgi:hypothetical protein
VSEDEEECLHYLNKVDVVSPYLIGLPSFFFQSEEFTDEKHIFTFKFLFDVNPFFENDELVKEYSVPSGVDAIGTCTATKITWKPGKKLTSDMQDPSSQTFFDWFNDTSDPVNDEIADVRFKY